MEWYLTANSRFKVCYVESISSPSPSLTIEPAPHVTVSMPYHQSPLTPPTPKFSHPATTILSPQQRKEKRFTCPLIPPITPLIFTQKPSPRNPHHSRNHDSTNPHSIHNTSLHYNDPQFKTHRFPQPARLGTDLDEKGAAFRGC